MNQMPDQSPPAAGPRAAPGSWLVPLLMGAAFVFIFHRFWDQTPVFRDAYRFFAAAKYLEAAALRRGEFWAWRPGLFLGVPMLGDPQTSWYYPFNLLFLVLPFEPAYRVYVLLHYPLAALLVFGWLRDLRMSRSAAAGAGLAFSLSGAMISTHANAANLAGAAWAPLALWGFQRALARGPSWSLAAGAGLALQLLGGDPQAAVITAALIGLGGVSRLVRPGGRGRVLASLAVCAGSAAVLSLAQLGPTYEFMSLSIRKSGLAATDPWLQAFSFHPARLVELVWPSPFTIVEDRVECWAKFALDFEGSPTPWSLTSYLGLPVIVLAGWGMGWGRRSWRPALAAAMAVFLVLAFGSHAPLFHWLHRLPGFVFFRYPEKYLVWFSGAVALAAAAGLECLDRRLADDARSLSRPAGYYLVLSVALAAAGAWLWPRGLDHEVDLRRDPLLYAAAYHHLLVTGAHFLGLNLAAGLLLLLAAHRAWLRPRTGALFVGLAAAGLAWANVPMMPAGPVGSYDPPSPVSRAIIADGGAPQGHYRIFREHEFFYADQDRRLTAPLRYQRLARWQRETLLSNLHELDGFEDLTGYGAARPSAGVSLLTSSYRMDLKLMELYNTKYGIAAADREMGDPGRAERIYFDPAQNVSVWKLNRVKPRAYWVPAAVAAADESQALELLATADLDRTVILTTGRPLPAPAESEAPWRPATVASYAPDRVVIDCEAPAAGWLVLLDRFYPGWSASVDGAPAEIQPANVMARAVAVGPGSHRVEFRFAPALVRWTAAISAAAWIALAAGAWLGWRRRRKPVTMTESIAGDGPGPGEEHDPEKIGPPSEG